MKKDKNVKPVWKWSVLAVAALAAVILCYGVGNSSLLKGQSTPGPAPANSRVFTPEHKTIGEAVRHFFGMRPTPVQPIAYVHSAHIVKAGMECGECHVGVAQGPNATIPGVRTCMLCHDASSEEAAIPNNPVIQQVNAYFKRGEEIPWQRVYGWNEEEHVRFNHAPHIKKEVPCQTCHGDLSTMTVATKVVDHTMGFCVSCHKERKVSNDCMTCHY